MSREVFICDAIRTPIGRLNGGLAPVRADDLAAIPLRALMQRNPQVDWSAVDEVFMGCANQSGEDNRNVARMALLLAGLPASVPGVTLNRLCASGMEAVGAAFRAIASGEMALAIAAGVESMTRAPYVMGKADSAFGRTQRLEDTTLGWRFVNPALRAEYGVDSMPVTGDNVAHAYAISRAAQDAFACAASNVPPRPARRAILPKKSCRWSSRANTARRLLKPMSTRAPGQPLLHWKRSSRSTARGKRSRRAMRRASTMVPAPWCWRRPTRGPSMG